jgi:ATP-dependent RNA helicase DDX3X
VVVFCCSSALLSSASRRPKLPLPRNERLERELFGEVKTGINFENYENIPVETSGEDVPPPIQHFKDYDFHEVLQQNIALSGYDRPTPVQRHSVPIAGAGRDLMACAQTGSGKTAAFLFPLITKLLRMDLDALSPPDASGGGMFGRRSKAYPFALILAPTRELATQIHDEARKFTYRSGLRPVVVYGGQEVRNQLRELDNGCDIMIATPGR